MKRVQDHLCEWPSANAMTVLGFRLKAFALASPYKMPDSNER